MTRGPQTRMGNIAGYRAAWIQAEAYRRRWDKWLENRQGDPPTRDLNLETLAEVLRGNILVHNHCYLADEMMPRLIDVSKRILGYKVFCSFHHAVEAYKIADVLAKEGIAASMWADWGGGKMEMMDDACSARTWRSSMPPAGSRSCTPTIHQDRSCLNQEAAKAMAAGHAAGINITEEDAIRWMTYNPAWALGLEDKIGSLVAVQKRRRRALVWESVLQVYTRAEKVWIDGAMLFDRTDPRQQWRTDFELGFVPAATTENHELIARHDDDVARGTRCSVAAFSIRDDGADDRDHRRNGVPDQRPENRKRHGHHHERQNLCRRRSGRRRACRRLEDRRDRKVGHARNLQCIYVPRSGGRKSAKRRIAQRDRKSAKGEKGVGRGIQRMGRE